MDLRPQTNGFLSYLKLSSLAIALIGLSSIGLYWLGLIIVLFSLGFIAIFRMKSVRSNLYLYALVALMFVISFVLLIQIFVFEVYNIPSVSMTPTLLIGDKVLVSKLDYGPKLPRYFTEIPWLNIFFLEAKESKIMDWGYHRLPGYVQARRNDIMVFTVEGKKLVKRCLAAPGEIFEMRNGEVHVNGQQADLETIQQTYRIWSRSNAGRYKSDQKTADYNLLPQNYIERIVNRREREQLLQSGDADSVVFFANGQLFASAKDPWYKLGDWTLGDIGPILVPDKGDRIPLNDRTYAVYQKLIAESEGVKLFKKEKSYFLEGKLVKSYVFKKRYYFFMGDNRDKSIDSRFFGLISEENIEGKAVFVLGSNGFTRFCIKP